MVHKAWNYYFVHLYQPTSTFVHSSTFSRDPHFFITVFLRFLHYISCIYINYFQLFSHKDHARKSHSTEIQDQHQHFPGKPSDPASCRFWVGEHQIVPLPVHFEWRPERGALIFMCTSHDHAPVAVFPSVWMDGPVPCARTNTVRAKTRTHNARVFSRVPYTRG